MKAEHANDNKLIKMDFPRSPVTHGYPRVVADNLHKNYLKTPTGNREFKLI